MSKPSKFRAYGQNIPLIDVFPFPLFRTSAPTSTDRDYEIGQLWVYKNGNSRLAYIYGGDDSSGDAVWSLASPGDSDVDTLTGDSGTATPEAGNIKIAGGTNLTSVAGTATVTVNLDATVVLETSMSSPLYTVAAATDLAITAASGQDIVMKMGDDAGVNKVSFLDSASVEVFAINSNGAFSISNLSNTGTFTTSGGTASINASSNFNTLINTGTSNGTLTIGSSNLGAIVVDTSAGISLDAVTASNLTVTGAADLAIISTLGGVNISSGEAATSTGVTIDASAANGGVTISAGTGGILIGDQADCTTIDLGNLAPTASRTITVGGGTVVTASVTDTIDIGPDGATTNADSIKTVNINTGTVVAGQLLTNLASGAITSGTHTTSIVSGNVAGGTVAVNLLSGTGTKTLNVGNSTGTTMNLDGPFLLNDSINSNTSLNTGTSTGTVSVGNSAAGAITVDTAAGISLDSATASNFTVTGAADLSLASTSGSISVTAGEADAAAIALQAVAGGLDIDLGLALIADAAGNIEINSSAGTILIGNDDIDQNASFATDGVRVVTVGSTNAGASLILQAGTGEITVTGTVKEITAEFLEASGDEITALSQSPLLTTAATTAGVATGASGDVNLMSLQQGVLMEQFIIGTQTIIGPRMEATGLDISLDQTAADGVEYNFGAARTNSRHAFTIGTSAAFFFEVTLNVEDLSGCDPLVIGFRKAAANNAVLASYTDYASLGINQGTSALNVVLMTELNGGGQTITNTTDAWGGDGTARTLKVLVSSAGVVTYTIDGSAPSVTAALTFDNADVVCPFIHFLQGADVSQVWMTSMKCGFQA